MPRRFPKEFAKPAISDASGSRVLRRIRANFMILTAISETVNDD
jgi:hypothetical protein